MIALWAALLGGVFGAIIGSFLATVVLRWPQGRSVLRGRSACDGCGRTLAPWELVPLFSAIIQRGRCRSCGVSIDRLHLWMECACMSIGALALALAPGMEGAGWAILGWMLLTLAVLDARHFWLPDALTLPLAFLGFTLGIWVTDVSLIDRAIGAALGYGVLLAIAIGYRAARGRDGLGFGDAKLLGALGAWFGWQALPFLLLFASGLALLMVGLGTLFGRLATAQTRVALGAFLAAAALPSWLTVRLLLGSY